MRPYPVLRGRVESYSTPVLWHDQLVLDRAGIIEGYQTSSGKRLWSLAANTSGASTPTVSDDVPIRGPVERLGRRGPAFATTAWATLVKLYDKKWRWRHLSSNLKFTARPDWMP
jgi:hypothetical protein